MTGLQSNYTERRDGLLDAIANEFDLSEETAEPTFFGGIKMLVANERTPAWAPYAYVDEKKKNGLFSFIPPTSGMFVWVGIITMPIHSYTILPILTSWSHLQIRVPLVDHPDYRRQLMDTPVEPTEHLEAKLFFMLAEHKLLIGPGWFFSTRLGDSPVTDPSDPSVLALSRGSAIDAPNGDPVDHDPAQYAHFRIAFSSASVSTPLWLSTGRAETDTLPNPMQADQFKSAMHILDRVLKLFFKDAK